MLQEEAVGGTTTKASDATQGSDPWDWGKDEEDATLVEPPGAEPTKADESAIAPEPVKADDGAPAAWAWGKDEDEEEALEGAADEKVEIAPLSPEADAMEVRGFTRL
jgi:hypothetical protein